MKYALILVLLLLTGSKFYAQVGLVNGDLEDYIDCPSAHGQMDLAVGWFTAIITPDFYNCSFVSITQFPSTTQAYSGQGWAGFLCSETLPPKAEAIGQHLAAPLLPEHDYMLKFAAKIPTQGDYMNNCGGIAVYGFKSDLVPSTSYTHASSLPSAMFLGESEPVLNVNWEFKEIALSIPDTVSHIALTIAAIPWCQQYIFVDSLSLTEVDQIGIVSILPDPGISVRTVPGTGQVGVYCDRGIEHLVITDVLGRIIHEAAHVAPVYTIDLEYNGMAWVSCYTGGRRKTIGIVLH
ncbi:MAG TPA: hypothetical protein PLV70_12970 [Flavobacteriales bacterium]|nr:hypothetical protein [Flavobacteriales bacterium]HRO39318.1 hypothetical protein [Flavobacteriales bacterium]HRP81772.1 hypothetical protein [Flavobacteriales bacterium]HRQ86019.1 hypothetical protein [Flavobacteriales bacterium]